METQRVWMVALRPLYYGRDVKAGETFQVAAEHVTLLTKLRSAKAGDAPPVKKDRYKRRDMRPEE